MTGTKPKFVCDSCGRPHTWKPQYAGKKAKCSCGAVMRIPLEEPVAAAPPEPEPELEPQSELMGEPQPVAEPVAEIAQTFLCPGCGHEHRWKPEIAGKKGRCKCGHMLDIPANAPGQTPEPALSTVEPPHAPPGQYGVAGDVAPVKKISRNAGMSGSAICPSCSEPVAAAAVICVNCGFHLKDGTTLQTKVHGKSDARERTAAASGTGLWFSRLTKRKPS